MSGNGPAVILRAAQRAPVPWKNGGGLTREVAVYPPTSDLGSFDWRVSMAEVRGAGPFSLFPGVDRRLAVLEGRLRLAIEARAALTLSPESAPVVFAGDVPAVAQPLGAAVTDLNVMTRRGRFDSRLQRHTAAGPTALPVGADATLVVALSQLQLSCRAGVCALSRLDAALIEGAAHCRVVPQAPQGSFYLIELRARPAAR
jgi:environmental stress-induced protein Ves